ncbi:hypothetical protein QQF64_002890 [Cirrhinus molitorella]|uniref:Prolactin receptor n=1 Tax=Cirrhinus molitorella TaxID=172907 RepID=A0ABR3MRH1_9TELE
MLPAGHSHATEAFNDGSNRGTRVFPEKMDFSPRTLIHNDLHLRPETPHAEIKLPRFRNHTQSPAALFGSWGRDRNHLANLKNCPSGSNTPPLPLTQCLYPIKIKPPIRPISEDGSQPIITHHILGR